MRPPKLPAWFFDIPQPLSADSVLGIFDRIAATVPAVTAAPITAAAIMQAADMLRKTSPPPTFDALVCTWEGWAAVCKEVQGNTAADCLYGVRVWVEETHAEALARCVTLRSEGKMPALLVTGGSDEVGATELPDSRG